MSQMSCAQTHTESEAGSVEKGPVGSVAVGWRGRGLGRRFCTYKHTFVYLLAHVILFRTDGRLLTLCELYDFLSAGSHATSIVKTM